MPLWRLWPKRYRQKYRAKTQNRAAIRVVLKLKFANHRLITRSRSLSAATQMQHDIFAAVNELLKPETGKAFLSTVWGGGFRRAGCAPNNITPASLLDLVDEKRQKKNRPAAIDQLQEKLEGVLKTGRQFKPQDNKFTSTIRIYFMPDP